MYPVSIDNLLLRGSSLKNTEFIQGVVVYVGHQTKIMKNSANSRVKVSCNEKMLNRQILYIFCLQLGLCLFGAIYGTLVEKANITESLSYLEIQQEYSTLRMNYFVWCIIKLGSWILMFTYFIPISLVMTIEFVRLLQGQFITYDVDMFDQEKGIPAKVQTSNLNEELGMVSQVFTDKTGTLTRNVMTFRKFSVGELAIEIESCDTKYLS